MLPGTLGGAKGSSSLEPEGGGIVWNWSKGLSRRAGWSTWVREILS